MSKQTNEQKLNHIRGTNPDEYGRTWMDVISDVWDGTFERVSD